MTRDRRTKMNLAKKIEELKEMHRDTSHGTDALVGDLLVDLAAMGYTPGIYRRGRLWRVHIDVGGNFWHDGRTPLSAFRGAIKAQLRHEQYEFKRKQ